MSAGGLILDWLGTGASVSGVFASLFVHDVAQRVAIRFGTRVHQKVVSSQARWINRSATLTGARHVVRGKEHIDPAQNYIVVMNHQSLLDISMASDFLGALMPRYVSKAELARGIPGVSYNLRKGGSALINRKDPGQAHTAIAEISRRVREDGWTVVIFPEGTRSQTGAMKPFKPGGLRTLVQNAPNVPVLPVTSYGGSRMFRKGLLPVQRNIELGFIIHPPMKTPDASDEGAFGAFVEDLQGVIASALPDSDLRGEAKHPARPSEASAHA
ncbi:1-acyl-sn-glycerol-3-phosphate acyltransferase [Minicystis rosea]|nr:1-acyl-sn-glycerol-3-phosphate acyltransferase [Minicystis rosea]